VSYAGTGTVKTNWQQAQNLIAQQTQIIIAELVEAERQIRLAKLGRENAERALESYKAKPDSYSEGWYVKELGKAREARHKLESDLRRAQGFMKLKDQAKIKVERTRDEAQRKLKEQQDINELLRLRAQKADDLAVLNQRQANAFADQERELRMKDREITRLREENTRLMQVIRLGREGLQKEQW